MAFAVRGCPMSLPAAGAAVRQCSLPCVLQPLAMGAPAHAAVLLPPCPVAPAAARRRDVLARVVIKSRVERSDDEIQEVLYTTEQLNEVLDEMGRKIGADYQGKDLLVLGVLKGGFVFTADLVRHIHPVPNSMEVDFFKASSYGSSTETSGTVKLDGGFNLASVKNKHVLVAEDIIDSGLTMSKIVGVLRAAGAMSVRVAVLLDKRTRRKVTFDADYVGIVCPDEFVVGYGIDFAERYRWLPYIGVPKPEVVEAILAAKKQQKETATQSMDDAPQGSPSAISSDSMGPIKAAPGNSSKASASSSATQAATLGSNGVLGFKGFGDHISKGKQALVGSGSKQ